MRRILTGPIEPTPQLFLSEPDDGSGGEAFPLNTSDVPGNELPDFSHLDAKYGDAPPEPKEASQETETETETPVVEEEPTGDRPRGKDGKFVKKAGESEEEFPEIPESKPEAEKEKKDDTEAGKKKAAEEAPEGKKEGEQEIPENDEDIERLKPRPTLSDKDQASFKEIKAKWKQDRELARRLQSEVQTLRGGGALDDATKAELERLRGIEKVVLAETHPDFQREVEGAVIQAEDSLFKMLVEDPRLLLSKENADSLRKLGLDSQKGRDQVKVMLDKIKETGDHILLADVTDAIRARDQAVRGRDAKVAEVRKNADSWFQQRHQAQIEEQKSWGKNADEHLRKLVMGEKDASWLELQEIPENATKEQKAAIEAHNKRVTDEIAPRFHETIRSIYTRDPQKCMEVVFRAIERDELAAQLKASQAELAKRDARIADLTNAAKGVKRISNPARVESAPPEGKKAGEEFQGGSKEISAEDALDSFARSKGYR